MGEIYIELRWELFCQSNSFGREVNQSTLLWIGRVSLHRRGICVQFEHSLEVAKLKELNQCVMR